MRQIVYIGHLLDTIKNHSNHAHTQAHIQTFQKKSRDDKLLNVSKRALHAQKREPKQTMSAGFLSRKPNISCH